MDFLIFSIDKYFFALKSSDVESIKDIGKKDANFDMMEVNFSNLEKSNIYGSPVKVIFLKDQMKIFVDKVFEIKKLKPILLPAFIMVNRYYDFFEKVAAYKDSFVFILNEKRLYKYFSGQKKEDGNEGFLRLY